ncbi:gustatory and odorant receptor 24-like [Hetaerina americana]|uniref:gustatory and odorant receptor 24-like n=1 Tax=Hetaerina americana TaxID=62018 RepID=UPI003A7F5CBD
MPPMHLAAYWIIATQMYLNSAFVWATSKALQAASKGLVQGLRRDANASATTDAGSILIGPGTRRWPQEYMDLWRKLSIMVRYSGSGAIGTAFMLNIGKEFPAMLLAAYGVIAWVDGGTQGNESGVLLILIHHLGDLILLGNSAHNAAHSAGSDIRDELSLMMVKPRTSHKVKKEIREFLQLMDASPPYITVGGYVILDKELVSRLLGTMVTYLVVLLQFRHAMHTPTIPWIYHPTSSTNTTTNELDMGVITATDGYKY